MKSLVSWVSVAASVGVGLVWVAAAGADGDHKPRRVRAVLTGFSEVTPAGGAVSTTGRGTFRADIDEVNSIITYTLKYSGLSSPVTQSHLHFGQHHTSGGISVWLCQTATPFVPATGPAAPLCAPEVSGTLVIANVIGPAGQGIAAGEFAELVAAIRGGVVYANVHTTSFGAGEIRGQLF